MAEPFRTAAEDELRPERVGLRPVPQEGALVRPVAGQDLLRQRRPVAGQVRLGAHPRDRPGLPQGWS
ncbi:hypothetical protein ABZ897_05685 [Nonomuraea sp. NPDC046802]|uniref:hypothetical protein n=1 Tax=Nonomuraea sp. NPDC046802 TaxID=3154919 RepID=UPI0033E1BDBB